VKMLGVPVSLKGIALVVTGASIAALFTRSMVDATD